MPETLKAHYLSELALRAKKLTPSQVPAKIKAGWTWYQLSPGFCTFAGSYRRALVSPKGELAYVSDRAPGPEDLASLPVFELCHDLLPLAVPFEEKAQAKALGAVWVAERRTWACAPDQKASFGRWLAPEVTPFNLLETA